MVQRIAADEDTTLCVHCEAGFSEPYLQEFHQPRSHLQLVG